MSTRNKIPKADDVLAEAAPSDAAEQRAWMNERIESALQAKRDGTARFKSLEDVRRKFGH